MECSDSQNRIQGLFRYTNLPKAKSLSLRESSRMERTSLDFFFSWSDCDPPQSQ